jgi:glycosyltransferase involved in cell wall biosynthesis
LKSKVCIVVSSPLTINAFLLEPIKMLSEHYDVYIIVNGNSEDISSYLEQVTVLSCDIERKISPRQDLAALFQLIKLFKRHDFQLVHSVTPKAGLLAMMASFFTQVPVRIHIFTGQVWATRIGLSRWGLKLMDRVISTLATDILVDSISQRQFLLDENVVNDGKSSVLSQGSISGVDLIRFKPDGETRLRIRQKYLIKKGETVFLFIGRLNRDKGVLDLAAAFERLDSTNSHLLIVGPDEAGIGLEMEAILTNCLDRVHFIGFTKKPEHYMAAADVLCLPSYREGFGSVVIEAAAMGVPAIGSRIYGVEDAIVDEQTGLLFEAGNREQLEAKMTEMIVDKERYQSLAKSARERAIEHFSSGVLATAWLDYYKVKL